MALNELDREKVFKIIKRNSEVLSWMQFCLDEMKKENIKLLDAWRD